jgi:hypothetical protein
MPFVFSCEYRTIFTVQKQDIYALYPATKGAGFTVLFDNSTVWKPHIRTFSSKQIYGGFNEWSIKTNTKNNQ